MQTQSRYVVNAAYLRIKNIQLGYTLPATLSKKFGVSRLRVYTSADNLVTFTKLPKIFDPEATGGDWGPGKIYPLQRTISFGLNVNI
jgi:tonB-dependent receptor plug domain protein